MIAIGYDVGSSFIKAALVDVKSGKSLAVERVPVSYTHLTLPTNREV